MRRLMLVLVACLGWTGAALADEYVTEPGHLICTRQDRLNDAREAISKHDKQWLDSIRECSLSQRGMKAEVLQEGPLTSKVMIYDDKGNGTVYWTAPDTLKEVRR